MMKTEKRKANVGERILVMRAVSPRGHYNTGDIRTVKQVLSSGVIVNEHDVGLYHGEYEVIVETPPAPKKSARITALESQVATLQAKVEALESASKYPLTAQFERESTSNCEAVDAILADIERKAKPTLEALLATYPAVQPTANEERADVIKRAKAFVGEGFDRWLGNSLCTVEFIVNTDKRTVVALAHRKFLYHTQVVRKGIAKCDPDDVFNADIGKAIALARALGVEVPTEFVKAVQPTEVVVGMTVVSQSWSFEGTPQEVMKLRPDLEKGAFNTNKIGYLTDKDVEITDDTDAVYE